jgi:hypothetical protein
MSLNKTYKTKERFLVPAGSHVAKLYSIVDLGTQDTGFRLHKKDKDGKEVLVNGKPVDLGPQITDQVFLTFELQDVRIGDGRPAAISPNAMSSSLFKQGAKTSKLRGILDVFLGSSEVDKRIDANDTISNLLKDCLGKACLLSVVHNESKGNVYSNFGSIVPLPSSMQKDAKPVENKLVLIDDCSDEKAVAAAGLPKFILEKIAKRITEDSIDTDSDESPY